MTNITASLVKELRDKTGAGMMDCKNALNENNGDIESSIDWLRTKGLAKAAKKSGRTASEGLIVVSSSDDFISILEVNSETDFVAKDENFVNFANEVASVSLGSEVTDVQLIADLEMKNLIKGISNIGVINLSNQDELEDLDIEKSEPIIFKKK